MSELHRQILMGDAVKKIKEIPDETIDVEISSPPYFGLRDYGVEGQLGLEDDYNKFLDKIHELMIELKRVLKKTGSCWINIGDTYAGGRGHFDFSASKYDKQRKFYSEDSLKARQFRAQKKDQLQDKTQMCIPERFKIRAVDDGWIARNTIPWFKPNAMPSSINDRLTNKWEPVYFFVKNKKYYFNLDAVRVKSATGYNKYTQSKNYDDQTTLDESTFEIDKELKMGGIPGVGPTGISRNRKEGRGDFEKKQDNTLMANGKPDPTKKDFNDRWKNRKWVNNEFSTQGVQTVAKDHSGVYRSDGSCINNPNGKNPGDIFTFDYTDEELLEWIKIIRENNKAIEIAPDFLVINTQPFPDAHFATFPEALPEFILKAACPPNGIVLDPFFGAGTVGVVAEKLNLQWVGIELNPKYEVIARKRLDKYLNKKII